MFRRRLARELAEATYSLVVTFSIGCWAVHAAYLERGYCAISGEYCLILITYLAAWKSIHCLFEALEELDYERHCKKGEVEELLKSEITDDQFLKALGYAKHKQAYIYWQTKNPVVLQCWYLVKLIRGICTESCFFKIYYGFM